MTIPIPTGPPARKPLGPGLIAFIVIDVILVVGVVIAAVVLLGGGSGAPGASPTTPVAGATTPVAGATTSVSPSAPVTSADRPGGTDQRFATPSGNIVCDITANGARCGIASLAQKPAPVDGCDGSVGFVYVVDASGKVDVPCVPKKELPKKAGKDVNVLGYGQKSAAYGFTCTSDESGMACVDDATGTGFSLARAGGRVL
ncbi:hypothetical protein [Sanguibacter massiliensis]|uniref:hypothetical protein n=1 Tax=Sanguibacter massiliensis TaxID=1973217 RepID=UPI000C852E85|nr:hypothetical protein [Sanguibacter massiliensis]